MLDALAGMSAEMESYKRERYTCRAEPGAKTFDRMAVLELLSDLRRALLRAGAK